MNRIAKLLRKPLLAVSIIVLAVFTGILVVTSMQTHGDFYSYNLDLFFMQIGTTYDFVDNQTVVLSIYMNNEIQSEEKILYKIENGNLYLYEKSFEEEGVLEGKITAYTIELVGETDPENPEDTTMDMTISVECLQNISRKTLCIAMISVGAFGLLISIICIAVYKRKYKLAKQQAIEQSIESSILNTEAQQAPAQPECPYCDSKLTGNEEICPVCHAKLK